MLVTNSTLSLQRKFAHNELTHPMLDVNDESYRNTRMVYDKLSFNKTGIESCAVKS
jgi:hypothetical protein